MSPTAASIHDTWLLRQELGGGSHWPRFINLQKNFRNLFVAGEIIYLIAIIQWPAAAAAVAALLLLLVSLVDTPVMEL